MIEPDNKIFEVPANIPFVQLQEAINLKYNADM